MDYIKHYIKILGKILGSDYTYSKRGLFYGHLTLVIRSFLYYKFGFYKKTPNKIKHHRLLGLKISFHTYPQLIGLIEEIFIYQVYKFESETHSPAIIDCGSNIGLSVLYFKKIFPLSTILAIEPDTEAFLLLKQNVENNKITNVTFLNAALSNFKGVANLYRKTLDTGSLNMSLITTEDRPFNETVSTETISSFIHTEINMLKIDVEGGEILILEDLLMTKKNNLVNKMIIEYHPGITNISIEEFIKSTNLLGFNSRVVVDNLHAGATEVVVHCTSTNQWY